MMRRLVVQIPCFNESEQIEQCLRCVPRHIPGFSQVETLVIDDGSTDRTVEAARAAGAGHILELGQHRGLAQAFYIGLKYAFTTLHADVLVNFDADMQYLPADIPRLVAPLIHSEADYVLGERQYRQIPHWSSLKLQLQILGSLFVSLLSGYHFKDATTGFRALNREAGLRMSVLTSYTYTVETLLHAVNQNLRILCIPILTRAAPTRPSRLVKSTASYCFRAVRTAVVTLLRHRAFEIFLVLSGLTFMATLATGLLYITKQNVMGIGPMVELDLCRTFMILSVTLLVAAIVSDNIYTSRRVVDELRYELRLREIERATGTSAAESLEVARL